jgi:hypothetical protein
MTAGTDGKTVDGMSVERMEDLSAVFKKMAILKPASEIIETTAAEVKVIADNTDVSDLVALAAQSAVEDETSLFAAEVIEIILSNPVGASKKRKKAAVIFESQISLFDMFDFLDASA